MKRSAKPYRSRTADDLGKRRMACRQDVVLFVAADPERIALRRRELERAGIGVLAAKDRFEALNILAMGIADAVVIEEASPMNCRITVQKMREINRGIPLILSSCPPGLQTRNAKIFDRCIPSGASSDALASAIREVLFGTKFLPGSSTIEWRHFQSDVMH